MGYFDYLLSGTFHKDNKGKLLFNAGWIFSKPYIIETKDQETELRKRMSALFKIYYPAMIVIIITFFVLWEVNTLNVMTCLFVCLFLWFLLYHFGIAKKVKTLKRAKDRISFRQFSRNFSAKHTLPGLIIGFLASLLFSATGVVFLFIDIDMPVYILLLIILFFGFCTVSWGSSLLMKQKK